MAIYNEILVGRFNRSLQKLFGIKGSPPVRQVAGEISPTHTLAAGVELRFLEQWNRYGFATFVAAAAGINGTLRIRNPVGSNVLFVLEKASAGGEGASDSVRLGMVETNADLVASATGINNRIDRRQGSTGSNAILSNSDLTHPGSTISTLIGVIPAVTMYEFITYENQEIPVLPGQAVDLWAGAVNQQVICSLLWRERYLEESERA